jgi:hypothetical protein
MHELTRADIVLPQLHRHLPLLLDIISWSSYGGLTLMLSTLRDTISAVTLHLYISHRITLSLVRWQLDSLSGLWNLFRGEYRLTPFFMTY